MLQGDYVIRGYKVTGVQTCALPMYRRRPIRFTEPAHERLDEFEIEHRARIAHADSRGREPDVDAPPIRDIAYARDVAFQTGRASCRSTAYTSGGAVAGHRSRDTRGA